jgi:endonuclease III
MTKREKVLRILAIIHELFPENKTELEHTHDYELLFAVIMSAQTTDKQVNKVNKTLFVLFPTLESFAKASVKDLEASMSSIPFFRNKAKNIHSTANKLLIQYAGTVPNTLEKLMKLDGVGKKTANVVLSELYNIHEGIAVDTHVKRLSKQLGLTTHTDPLKIEKDLMRITPQHEWRNLSHGLILYGRYHWSARKKYHTGPLAPYALASRAKNPVSASSV